MAHCAIFTGSRTRWYQRYCTGAILASDGRGKQEVEPEHCNGICHNGPEVGADSERRSSWPGPTYLNGALNQ